MMRDGIFIQEAVNMVNQQLMKIFIYGKMLFGIQNPAYMWPLQCLIGVPKIYAGHRIRTGFRGTGFYVKDIL